MDIALSARLDRPRLLLAALALLLALSSPALAAGGKITAPDTYAKLQAGKIVLIDVRSPAEWRQTGIPEGAKTVSIHDPDGMAGFMRKVLTVMAGRKDRPVALICARGVRSSRAYRYLRKNGFTEVFDVSEGFLGRMSAPGWVKRGLPVARCASC